MTPQEHEDKARGLLWSADSADNMRTASFFATVAIAHMQMAEVERRSRTENVECRTCNGGREWWTAVQANPCPDCGGSNSRAKFCDYCGRGGIHTKYLIENCPKCSTTPENVGS